MEINYILIVAFAFLLLVYLLFLHKVFYGLLKLKRNDSKNFPDEFVSIIIPFRNEEAIILNNLKSLGEQDYPPDKFEIIYVDDSSEDKSSDILEKNKSLTNVKMISVPDEFSPSAHKKRAIRFGIENSKGEIIVTTDADCIYNKSWLSSLLSNLDENSAFVSGPVEFISENNFFSNLQKLEFAGLVLTGAGLIGSGRPTICNAANIAYYRKVFNEVGGFKYQMNLSSGDDELLMQKISKDTNYEVKFSLNEKSIVKTSANNSLHEFYHQRKRWASKGLFYNDKSLIFKLILIYLFYTGLFVQLILALFLSKYFFVTFAVSVLLKSFFELQILIKGKRLLFKNLRIRYFILTEIFQIIYIVVAGLAGVFGNLVWKNRKIKR